MKFLFTFILIVLFAGCANDKQEQQAADNTPLYLDCRVTGEEGKEAVTVFMQFRAGDRNGAGVVLKDGAKVELDGIALTADSAGKSGTFYEVHYRLGEFSGIHSILYTDAAGKTYQQEFSFEPFTLQDSAFKQSRSSPLIFSLQGLDSVQPIHTIITDTAFSNNDINEIDTALNGTLTINTSKLRQLKSGPVALQLIRNTVKFFNVEGFRGRIATSYL